MSQHAFASRAAAPTNAANHHLQLDLAADPNALLRVLEPFVVHDVLPHTLNSVATGEGLRLSITFHASEPLAQRLHGRIAVLPVVSSARLATEVAPATPLTDAA